MFRSAEPFLNLTERNGRPNFHNIHYNNCVLLSTLSVTVNHITVTVVYWIQDWKFSQILYWKDSTTSTLIVFILAKVWSTLYQVLHCNNLVAAVDYRASHQHCIDCSLSLLFDSTNLRKILDVSPLFEVSCNTVLSIKSKNITSIATYTGTYRPPRMLSSYPRQWQKLQL